jgi:CBS domain-containing protein
MLSRTGKRFLEVPAMQVDNILKSKRPAVLWVSPVMTIGEVAERLRSTDVGAMIVSNDGEALQGLISERDIAQGLAVHGAALLSLKVQDLMTRSVISCSPEDNIADIARIMTMRRIRHIPVVEDGRLVGVVSIGDVLKSRISEIELEANVLRDLAVARR